MVNYYKFNCDRCDKKITEGDEFQIVYHFFKPNEIVCLDCFNTKEWMSEKASELGVDCQTSGCLASIMSFDPFFKEIGFEVITINEDNSITEDIKISVPYFGPFRGMDAMGAVFDLSSDQMKYIFGAHNPDYLSQAIHRIDQVLAGRMQFTDYELGIPEQD